MNRLDFLKMLGLTALAPNVIGAVDTFKAEESIVPNKLTMNYWLNQLPEELQKCIRDFNEELKFKMNFDHECESEKYFYLLITEKYHSNFHITYDNDYINAKLLNIGITFSGIYHNMQMATRYFKGRKKKYKVTKDDYNRMLNCFNDKPNSNYDY